LKGQSRKGIVELGSAERAEIPLALRHCGKIELRRLRNVLAETAVVEEEERMVAHDWAADIDAELIPLKSRARLSARVQQEGVGIKGAVFDVLVDISMELIRAVFCDHGDVGDAAVAGIHIDPADLHFLQGAQRREIDATQAKRIRAASIARIVHTDSV